MSSLGYTTECNYCQIHTWKEQTQERDTLLPPALIRRGIGAGKSRAH